MHTFKIVVLFLLAAGSAIAEDLAVPVVQILPTDVVQSSIQQSRFGSNRFAVRWTFTEAGAKKMIAFWEVHEGRKISVSVGDFVSPPAKHVFLPMPPLSTNYAQWKAGWLKHRTDKIFLESEADARAVVDGLKKTPKN